MVKDDNKPDALELVIVSHTESPTYSILLWQEAPCLAYTNLIKYYSYLSDMYRFQF